MIEDNFSDDDFLLDDSLSDVSFTISEPDDNPTSVNIDISNGSTINKDDFTVTHYNINSITAEGRLEELSTVTSALSVDVLVCSESKLCQSIPSNIIHISGYHEPLRHDRTRHGGGCIIYISERLTFKHKNELQSDKYEHLWVDVRVNDKLYVINSFYRPPIETTESHSEFLLETEEILKRLQGYNADNKIIASDFNFGNTYCKYPILPPKPLDRSAPDLFSSYGCSQLIDIPTRVTENTTSLIDLIFVSNKDNIQSHGTLPRIADHDGTFVSFHCIRNKAKSVTKTIYDYKNVDELGLLNYIKNYDFQSKVFSKPVFEQAGIFTNILSEAVSKFVPTKNIVLKSCDQPWLNSYTRLLLRRKNRNYLFFKKINGQFLAATAKPNISAEVVTRLTDKKNKVILLSH